MQKFDNCVEERIQLRPPVCTLGLKKTRCYVQEGSHISLRNCCDAPVWRAKPSSTSICVFWYSSWCNQDSSDWEGSDLVDNVSLRYELRPAGFVASQHICLIQYKCCQVSECHFIDSHEVEESARSCHQDVGWIRDSYVLLLGPRSITIGSVAF